MKTRIAVVVTSAVVLVALFGPASSGQSYYYRAYERRELYGSSTVGGVQVWFRATVGEGVTGYGPMPQTGSSNDMDLCVYVRTSTSVPYKGGCAQSVVQIDPSLDSALAAGAIAFTGGSLTAVITAAGTGTPDSSSGSRLPPDAAGWLSVRRPGTAVIDVRAGDITLTGAILPVWMSTYVSTDLRVAT